MVVFRELLTHENVTFNDNGTLTASPSHPLVWVPELSEGRREDDLLTLPNIALLVSTSFCVYPIIINTKKFKCFNKDFAGRVFLKLIFSIKGWIRCLQLMI